jgi:hypothetical protein
MAAWLVDRFPDGEHGENSLMRITNRQSAGNPSTRSQSLRSLTLAQDDKSFKVLGEQRRRPWQTPFAT